jgi:hypothetical protein
LLGIGLGWGRWGAEEGHSIPPRVRGSPHDEGGGSLRVYCALGIEDGEEPGRRGDQPHPRGEGDKAPHFPPVGQVDGEAGGLPWRGPHTEGGQGEEEGKGEQQAGPHSVGGWGEHG